MKKFDRISSYNKKYAILIDNSIRKMLPLIIEASVQVFGEEHREFITHTLNNLNFAYTISESYIKASLEKTSGLSKKYIYLLNYYLKYLNYMNYKEHSKTPTESRDIKEFCFVGSDYLEDYNLDDSAISLLKEDCALSVIVKHNTKDNISKLCNLVLFPIIGLDIYTVFHELTHTITTPILGFNEDELIFIEIFPNVEVMELINDYTSLQIFKKYLELGGKIPKVFQNINSPTDYQKLAILIVDFYESFTPLILEATIIGSANILISRVGESNFKEFCDYVRRIFNSGNDIYQSDYDYLVSIIDKMLDYERVTKPFDKEKCFQALEEAGYRIRKLN